MPQGAPVRCVSWSGDDNFLACGCENGMLKVLKIEGTPPSLEKSEKSLKNTPGNSVNPPNRGFLAAPSNIAMNQTLEGHSSNIQVIAWNKTHQKLTTSDAKGRNWQINIGKYFAIIMFIVAQV